jgi:hypothetical protein
MFHLKETEASAEFSGMYFLTNHIKVKSAVKSVIVGM